MPATKQLDRYVQIVWHDDGRHEVRVVGIRRRAELESLLKAARRHAFACQTRGIPLDTPRTQRPSAVEEHEALALSSGE